MSRLPSLLTRAGRTPPDPRLVEVPEVSGVEHVAPPAGQQHAGQQCVVADHVQRPPDSIDGGVDDHQVTEQRDEHRAHRQTTALRPAQQPHSAQEQRQAEDAESGRTDQDAAGDQHLSAWRCASRDSSMCSSSPLSAGVDEARVTKTDYSQ